MSEQKTTANPVLPARIARLNDLANNLWWSWNPEASALFQQMDRTLWEITHHNPVRLLAELPATKIEAASTDPAFLRRYDGVIMEFDRRRKNNNAWFATKYPHLKDKTIAYFSAEFGVHSSLPIYSGGLGILAGDHCKEAADLGVPLVGAGFIYPQGYFKQHISAAGRQEATYERLDYATAPLEPVMTRDTDKGLLQLHLCGRVIHTAVWRVKLGSVSLYLMDTDQEENEPWDRELSARLYGGDRVTRLVQEIVLGIGGVRMLTALGMDPAVFHANEGHAAFLMLERTRILMEQGLSFDEAAEHVRATTVFTTHTPVPAGHDAFQFNMIEQAFAGYWEQLGLDRERFLALGAYQDGHGGTNFNMTALALRLSGLHNGVSELNGKISRQMWAPMYNLPEDEVPITHVTNGVHAPTWVAPELDRLFDKHLGRDWLDQHDDPKLWERLAELPDEELWGLHQRLKHKMHGFIRERARRKWIADDSNPTHILTSGTLLNPEALTIGFARRFATYKRALLIFRDMPRLKRILQHQWRPVQLIFAGKAHPDDAPGKNLIHELYTIASDHGIGGHIAFIENYDIHVAKHMYGGVDIWLNNPRPPLEASGTSGMKAAANGVPSLSVLDGWWYEGYKGTNGWAIDGDPLKEISEDERDAADIESLYGVLENEIVPLFFDRDSDGVPRGWVQVMKETIRTNAPAYSARRMVKEYTDRMYVTAMLAGEKPRAGDASAS
ncbi:MAG: alpha-glucan family phosphorylase [Blastocatellia bacterium]